ncbi:MAG: protein kinase [Actinobacteria bacterium]|nr:protein kinase [Actinomycetota bacterium]
MPQPPTESNPAPLAITFWVVVRADAGKTLGKGTFGKVKLAEQTLTGEKVAIKILEKDRIIDVADVERVSREIHILKLIRHPNIIQLYEVAQSTIQIIETPKQLFLVMEYMQNGELFDYIVKMKKYCGSQI